MDAIQWARVMRKAMDEVEGHIEANEEGLLSAFKKGKGKLPINISIVITSESSYSADVQSSISYVIERVKEGGSERVIFAQEELPLPDETKTTSRRPARGGAISAAQAEVTLAKMKEAQS